MFAASLLLLAACGGGGSGGTNKVSASSYVGSLCPALGTFEASARANLQRMEGKLPALLAGGAGAVPRARTLLLSLWDGLAAATRQLQKASDAAGTPDVPNGSKIVTTVHAAFGKLLGALVTLRTRTGHVSASSFATAIGSLAASIQPTLASAGVSLRALSDHALQAAARKSAACRRIGLT